MKQMIILAIVPMLAFLDGCSGCGTETTADGIIDGWPDGSDVIDWLTDEIPSGPCTPGEMMCNGPLRMRCSDDRAWVSYPCETGQICVGAGECQDRVCTPGERRCSPENADVVEACDPYGSAWEAVDTCTDRLVCMDGACVIEVCTPGEIRCAGAQYRQCDADGLGWSDPVECPEGQACNDGACADIICTPGDGSCTSDSTRLVCNSTGTAEVEEECMAGYVCIDGACRLQICPAGLVRCVDDMLYEVCNETGTAYDPGGSCSAAAGERCIDGACMTACDLAELNPSSVGCVFYAVDLDNYSYIGDIYGTDDSPYAVVVSNTNDATPAVVTVEDRRGSGGTWRTRLTQTINPNSLYTFNLTPDQHVEDTSIGAGYAYRLTSTMPVIAYQFNPIDSADRFTNDASLLLPKHTLGRYYYISSYRVLFNGTERGYVTVVGTQDGTSVTVRVTAATVAGGGIPALSAGGSHTATINEGDVLQISSNGVDADLTGTYVEASAPVAVFGGTECSDIPQHCTWCRDAYNTTPGYPPAPSGYTCGLWYACPAHDSNTCAWCDHVEEQMFPVNTWGMSYVAARVPVQSSGAVEAALWRIIASENATTVTIAVEAGVVARFAPGGGFTTVLNQGQFMEFELAGTAAAPGDAYISADKPVMVIQYIEGQECTNINPLGAMGGDPAMVLMVPTEQYLGEYIFLTPSTYDVNYVVVVKTAAATVTLDGTAVGGFINVGGGFQVSRRSVPAGVHHIEGTEPFGIIGVGYSPQVSYGYMGGLALMNINPQD